MPKKGDLVTDGVVIYRFENLSEGKVYLKLLDGADRVFNAAGNPMWVIPEDGEADVLAAMREFEAARKKLNATLQGLTPI